MRLLVNHQLIPVAIEPKSISLEQIYYKRSQGIATTSLHCLLFSTSKNKEQKRIWKSATNVMEALKFILASKFVFPSNVSEINNLITLRSTNEIIEISAL